MRLLRLFFLPFTLILSACTSIVNVDYDQGMDFTHFKTFTIQDEPVRVAQDTRLNSPFMRQRVVSELERALTAKSFKKAVTADLKVKYFLDIKPAWEFQDSGITVGLGTSGSNSGIAFAYSHPTSESTSFDKLVLTLDILSTATNKLVWRGSLAYRMDNGSNPESYSALINEMVVEILKKFPPNQNQKK